MPDIRDSTVDAREVAYYEGLAQTWWDRQGPFWPLHRLNELRVGYIRDVLCTLFERQADTRQPLRELAVLDVGCGGGLLSEAVARLGATVHGIDVVERNIAIAQVHAADNGLPVRYEAMTAESLRGAGARYDVLLNMEVVEHVADLAGFMRSCAALVRPSGVMVVATINRTLLSYLFAIVGAEYVLGWLPKGTHRWRQFVKPSELERMLQNDGFTVVARSGVKVNPFNRRFSLTQLQAVNYMVVARKQPA